LSHAIEVKLIVFTSFATFTAITTITTSLVALELKIIVFIVAIIITIISIFIVTIINVIHIIAIINISSHIPGNVSTYNEVTAPLLERLTRKRSHMPFDYKAAFDELLDLSQTDEDECIDAVDELLKQQLPESYRMRTHIVLATCLEDLDEMEEHHAEALRIWTRLNTRYTAGENPEADVWLQQTRAQIDCLRDTIEEERALEEQSDATSTPVKLSMSAVAAIETVQVAENATSRAMSQPGQPGLKNTSTDRSSLIPPGRPQTPVNPSGTSSYRATSPSDVD
jgi:hypothetical protein